MPALLAHDLEPLRRDFYLARSTPEYQSVFAKPNPLVTVCIATYNRCELLLTRSLRSILAQSYRNLQILVVGDRCTDDTEKALGMLRDSRVTFVNRAQRGPYPKENSWAVAGSCAMNDALDLAEGDFITHLDDDDSHTVDRTEWLLAHAQEWKADLLFHTFLHEVEPGQWMVNRCGGDVPQFARITTSSTFYHSFFKCLHWDLQAWTRHQEPGDWNRFKKFPQIGARTRFVDIALLQHFKEKQNHLQDQAA